MRLQMPQTPKRHDRLSEEHQNATRAREMVDVVFVEEEGGRKRGGINVTKKFQQAASK